MTASEASSSAISSASWRFVAPSSEKLKSTIHGRVMPSTTTLAARSDRCAILARCSPATCVHNSRIIVSLTCGAGISSRELPSTRSMASSADPSAALTPPPTDRPPPPPPPRDPPPGPLGHRRHQRLMLGGLDERRRRAGVADAAKPDEPVPAVQQVSVPLIRSENLNKQGRSVLGDRGKRPRPLRLHGRRDDA